MKQLEGNQNFSIKYDPVLPKSVQITETPLTCLQISVASKDLKNWLYYGRNVIKCCLNNKTIDFRPKFITVYAQNVKLINLHICETNIYGTCALNNAMSSLFQSVDNRVKKIAACSL